MSYLRSALSTLLLCLVSEMRTKGRVRTWRRKRKAEGSRKGSRSPVRRNLEKLQRVIYGSNGCQHLRVDYSADDLFRLIADYISSLELKASLLRTTISCFPLLVSKGNQLN
ncbi:hypothetical protein SAY86_025802 [Trapa natans]|uniref:Uncharacterized protein n=1 Tax=Trapa natans TaxID=22666 RepID=A0AAN7KEP1_TRANT|nr:hypothetical protein SAY86_025802 [Trapa natans]